MLGKDGDCSQGRSKRCCRPSSGWGVRVTGLQACTLHSPIFFFLLLIFFYYFLKYIYVFSAAPGRSPGAPPLSAGAGWSQASRAGGREGGRLPAARLLHSGYFKPTARSSLQTGGGIFLSFSIFFLFTLPNLQFLFCSIKYILKIRSRLKSSRRAQGKAQLGPRAGFPRGAGSDKAGDSFWGVPGTKGLGGARPWPQPPGFDGE